MGIGSKGRGGSGKMCRSCFKKRITGGIIERELMDICFFCYFLWWLYILFRLAMFYIAILFSSFLAEANF